MTSNRVGLRVVIENAMVGGVRLGLFMEACGYSIPIPKIRFSVVIPHKICLVNDRALLIPRFIEIPDYVACTFMC